MALPPDVIRINTLWRVQRRFMHAGLFGLGTIAAGFGLGFAGLGMRFASVTCTVGGAVAIASLLIAAVFGAMIASAGRGVTPQRLAEAPVEVGEMFGEMRVAIADDDTLHLSMGRSPLAVGLHRVVVSLALLGLAAGVVLLLLQGHAWGRKTWALAAAGVVGAVMVARTPFAMQWVAGDVHEEGPGISIERVRWFFVRDTLTVGADDILDLKLTEHDISLTTRCGANITLVRTPPSALSTWTKLRLLSKLSQTLGRELPVTELRDQLAAA